MKKVLSVIVLLSVCISFIPLLSGCSKKPQTIFEIMDIDADDVDSFYMTTASTSSNIISTASEGFDDIIKIMKGTEYVLTDTKTYDSMMIGIGGIFSLGFMKGNEVLEQIAIPDNELLMFEYKEDAKGQIIKQTVYTYSPKGEDKSLSFVKSLFKVDSLYSLADIPMYKIGYYAVGDKDTDPESLTFKGDLWFTANLSEEQFKFSKFIATDKLSSMPLKCLFLKTTEQYSDKVYQVYFDKDGFLLYNDENTGAVFYKPVYGYIDINELK